ncbi:hypothetical protein [Streptomyces sp. NPDC003006]
MRDQQWALDALKLPDAWEKAKDDDTVIAVVDTGVDLDRPDLKGRLVAGHDFVDGDEALKNDPDQIMRGIRASAKNPEKVVKLGLGVVDAKAAVGASPKS